MHALILSSCIITCGRITGARKSKLNANFGIQATSYNDTEFPKSCIFNLPRLFDRANVLKAIATLPYLYHVVLIEHYTIQAYIGVRRTPRCALCMLHFQKWFINVHAWYFISRATLQSRSMEILNTRCVDADWGGWMSRPQGVWLTITRYILHAAQVTLSVDQCVQSLLQIR